jgi:hypothetical protein
MMRHHVFLIRMLQEHREYEWIYIEVDIDKLDTISPQEHYTTRNIDQNLHIPALLLLAKKRREDRYIFAIWTGQWGKNVMSRPTRPRIWLAYEVCIHLFQDFRRDHRESPTISRCVKSRLWLTKLELDLNTLICLDVWRKRGRSTMLIAPTIASKISKGNDRMLGISD